jgi:hypothetical protein
VHHFWYTVTCCMHTTYHICYQFTDRAIARLRLKEVSFPYVGYTDKQKQKLTTFNFYWRIVLLIIWVCLHQSGEIELTASTRDGYRIRMKVWPWSTSWFDNGMSLKLPYMNDSALGAPIHSIILKRHSFPPPIKRNPLKCKYVEGGKNKCAEMYLKSWHVE